MAKEKQPVIDSTLHQLISNKNISIQHVRLLLLHIGVDLHVLFDSNAISHKCVPIQNKKKLIEKCTYFSQQQTSTTFKTAKTKGGMKNNTLQKKTFEILKKATTKYLNNDIPDVRKMLKQEHVEVNDWHASKKGKQYQYSVMVSLLLCMMYFAYRVYQKKNKKSLSMDAFLTQLPRTIQQSPDIAIGSKTESYLNTHECLKYIDVSLHKLFLAHTEVNQLRYQLFQLRKKRSYFYGRILLNEHLIRSDGSVRDSCGEIARSMAHHWSFQPIKSIHEFTRQTMYRTRRKKR